ncbi:unnamed protein product [Rotaria sp. Silwood2]|nr:unnamed protein product [Rotaria sp. Silwood2]CAF3881813.1 unnamed protein product [Rotaria sp. Silwood2]
MVSIFNGTDTAHEQTTTELNGQFLHSQLLIDCLVRMKSIATDKNELVSLCKEQYKKHTAELKNVHEFEQHYSSDEALRWYTRPSFAYRVLNKALRTQNIELLFLFRFFIHDIERQLEQHRSLSPLRIYRGQLMSTDELKLLQNSVGKFISINSFFSTTANRDVALFFLGDSAANDDLQRVLFEIDADPSFDGIKPFANITSLSYYPDEEEVLMMIGSIFRLINIHYEGDRIWKVRMKLCSDNDHDLKLINDYMKHEYFGLKKPSLGQLGNLLIGMGKFDDAEKYYRRLLKELPDDHQDIAPCYCGLGIVAFNKGNYDLSLDRHCQALKIFQRTLESNHPHLADSHNCIGSSYQRKGKYKQALKSYKNALVIYQEAFGDDHQDLAICFSNMGNIYHEEKKYSKALTCHQKALNMWQKYLPADHPHLGSTHNNLANVHYSLGQYNYALQHYNRSLEIKSKSLPSQHPSIASTFKNISDVYEHIGELQQALSYLKQAAAIYGHTLPSNHPYAIGIKKDIQRVASQRHSRR